MSSLSQDSHIKITWGFSSHIITDRWSILDKILRALVYNIFRGCPLRTGDVIASLFCGGLSGSFCNLGPGMGGRDSLPPGTGIGVSCSVAWSGPGGWSATRGCTPRLIGRRRSPCPSWFQGRGGSRSWTGGECCWLRLLPGPRVGGRRDRGRHLVRSCRSG